VTGTTSFAHETLPQRVVFGAGRSGELAAEVARLGGRRALLVSTEQEAGLAERLAVGVPVVAHFTGVRPHVPVEVATAARALAAEVDADVVVSIGGGSTTGTAKSVALTTGLPVVAVPTTYAGSEATPVWGLTEAARKTTGTDPVVLPRTVVYDPELTVTLPVDLGIASGLNALAHCVDSLWAPRRNPILDALALEAVRALAPALRGIAADGDDLEARAGCLYGAYLSASAFAGAGAGLHHKICHVLGGTWDLPHAATHAVVLPHVLAFNAEDAAPAAGRLLEALEPRSARADVGTGAGTDAVAALVRLYDDLGAPRALRDLGLPETGLDEATALVVAAAPADNPRPADPAAVRALLRRAWSGAGPVTRSQERNAL
jgi:maleylacetate reductase